MKDEDKTREHLLEELGMLRRRLSDLETSKAEPRIIPPETGQSEFEYRTLFENIPQKIFFKDADSVYLRVNASFARDMGISADDFVGKTDFDFFSKELADKYRADDRRIMSSGMAEEWDEEYSYQGETRAVRTLKAPARDADGNVVGVIGIFWDITKRKMVEARLQKEINFTNTLIHASPAFFVAIAPDGKTLLMNQSMLNALGYDLEEVVGKDYLLNFVPEAERGGLSSVFDELLTSHTTSSRNRVMAKDGRQVLVEWEIGRASCRERVFVHV
jgi:PAS domain S-box-containing protein